MIMRWLICTLTLVVMTAGAAVALPAIPVLKSSSENIAVGKPIDSNARNPGIHGIDKANDGDRATCWWGEKATPVYATDDRQALQQAALLVYEMPKTLSRLGSPAITYDLFAPDGRYLLACRITDGLAAYQSKS